MKNATQHKSGQNAQWPVRNEAAAAELHRTREMPLLFQLADVNRAPVAPIPPAPVAAQAPAAPAKPAPIELPTPSTFPLASSILESWPTASSIFDMPTGLGTPSNSLSSAALAIGVAAKETPKTETPTTAASVAVEKVAEKAGEKKAEPAIASSVLPAAIETAVKAATETSDAATKAEAKSETKSETKPESAPQPETKLPAKAETKTDAKVEVKAEAKVEAKAPAKSDSTARSKAAAPAAETATAATKTTAYSNTTPPTAANDKPSPASLRRQRAEARQAKVEGKGSDWLHTHGKVIAICFVIALVGTIYLARRNRGTTAPEPSSDGHNLAIEISSEHEHKHESKPAEAANSAPRLVEAPSHPLDTTPSPASTATPSEPAASSTAELQPPIVPNAGQSTTPPSSEPLFPWQNDSRVATRPDAPSTSATPSTASPSPTFNPPTGTQPTFNPPTNDGLPPSGPAPSGPTLNGPTYPETNLRDAPLLPPAPAATGNTAPAAAPTAPPPAPAPAAGQGGGRMPSRTYPASFTSAPGGNRYERTGSGLY